MTEYKRKLASIQIIEEILQHNNADSLELATVLGWQVVTKKGEFKSGDKIIYLEIDSVCPPEPWAQFLEVRKYRIKTIRLRGQLSQGLILPMSLLGKTAESYAVGDDVTEKLGITKYEPPDEQTMQSQGKVKTSSFPTHLGFSKTDEPRIQSSPAILQLFKGKKWYATIKYDGTSSTFLINPENPSELIVCSRNQKIGKPQKIVETNEEVPEKKEQTVEEQMADEQEAIEKSKNVYWLVAHRYKLFEVLSKFPHLVIQGEIYGPSVQGNKLNSKDLRLAVFTMYDLVEKRYCIMKELIDNCRTMGLEMVKIDDSGDCFDFTKDVLLNKAKGKYQGTKNDREGLVFRLQESTYVDGERASFKVINNDFLEKEK